MNDPVLTVIIPTYNRRDTLLKCLKALTHQSCSKECFEIILVDDGSTDGTDGAIHSWMDQKPCDVKYFQQENRGPAAARNVGIRNAKGQVLLFLGDDVIPNNNLLEEHMEWHKRFGADNSAMLGFVTWSPELEITPFMQWLENGGPQFSFRSIKDKNNVNGAVFFYTSNISVKRCFLLENDELFDEDFPYAAHEDSELGYRLSKKGLMLTYNEKRYWLPPPLHITVGFLQKNDQGRRIPTNYGEENRP